MNEIFYSKGMNYFDFTAQFEQQERKMAAGKLLIFKDQGKKHVYNPSLFQEKGQTYMAARVESPESFWLNPETFDPEIRFFERKNEVWQEVEAAPRFLLSEDPAVSWIHNKLILSRVILDRATPTPEVVSQFFQADCFLRFNPDQPFAEVRGMKDIRLLALPTGKIAVCGRPVGGAAGRGRVSFQILNSLKELTHGQVWNAPLLPIELDDLTKIGANALYLIPSRFSHPPYEVGVLGHIALGKDEVELHYAAVTWKINANTLECTVPKVCALRKHFPLYPAKYPWTADVVFPGTLIYEDKQQVTLYAGIGDSRVGILRMHNPF